MHQFQYMPGGSFSYQLPFVIICEIIHGLLLNTSSYVGNAVPPQLISNEDCLFLYNYPWASMDESWTSLCSDIHLMPMIESCCRLIENPSHGVSLLQFSLLSTLNCSRKFYKQWQSHIALEESGDRFWFMVSLLWGSWVVARLCGGHTRLPNTMILFLH